MKFSCYELHEEKTSVCRRSQRPFFSGLGLNSTPPPFDAVLPRGQRKWASEVNTVTPYVWLNSHALSCWRAAGVLRRFLLGVYFLSALHLLVRWSDGDLLRYSSLGVYSERFCLRPLNVLRSETSFVCPFCSSHRSGENTVRNGAG